MSVLFKRFNSSETAPIPDQKFYNKYLGTGIAFFCISSLTGENISFPNDIYGEHYESLIKSLVQDRGYLDVTAVIFPIRDLEKEQLEFIRNDGFDVGYIKDGKLEFFLGDFILVDKKQENGTPVFIVETYKIINVEQAFLKMQRTDRMLYLLRGGLHHNEVIQHP